MMEWLTILSFCILMFWGTGCASDCGCFTGCNYCSDAGGANITFVVGSVTTNGLCTNGSWCDSVNGTIVTAVPAGTTDCGTTADWIGNCMCDRQTVYAPALDCFNVGGNLDTIYLFSGGITATGGLAEVNMKLQVDLNASPPTGVIAEFEYRFSAPINCDTTNGPFSMTRTYDSPDNVCVGTTATATIQIGP